MDQVLIETGVIDPTERVVGPLGVSRVNALEGLAGEGSIWLSRNCEAGAIADDGLKADDLWIRDSFQDAAVKRLQRLFEDGVGVLRRARCTFVGWKVLIEDVSSDLFDPHDSLSRAASETAEVGIRIDSILAVQPVVDKNGLDAI